MTPQFIKSARTGKPITWYVYAFRGGPLVVKLEQPKKPRLTPDLMRQIAEAHVSVRADTMAGLARAYRKSAEWQRLAASTRRNWGPIVDLAEAKWGKTPLTIWSDPRMVTKVIAWRDDAAKTPRAADNRVCVLHHMLEWARLRGMVRVNVATGIPQLYRGGEREEIIWTREDRTAFAKVANRAVNDALVLACLTGLRLADLAALTWSEVGEHAIVRLALKESRRKRRKATVPITPDLRAHLTALKSRPRKDGVTNVLTTSEGRSWSADGLGKRVGEARTKAKIAHDDGRAKHLHDCRGTFATILIEAGLTDEEAGRVLAWSPERVGNIRRVYVDDARVVVALGERIAAQSAKHPAKRQENAA